MPEFKVGDRVKRIEGLYFLGEEGVVTDVPSMRWIVVRWDDPAINERHQNGQWDMKKFILVAPAPPPKPMGVTVNQFKDVDGADMVMISCTKAQALVLRTLLFHQSAASKTAAETTTLMRALYDALPRVQAAFDLIGDKIWKFTKFEVQDE